MHVTIKIDDLSGDNITGLTADIAQVVKKYDASYFKIEASED